LAEVRQRDVLLFDLDGTLVDSAPVIARALSQIGVSRGGGKVEVDQVRPLISYGVEALVSTTLGSVENCLADDIVEFRSVLRQFAAKPEWLYPDVVTALAALSTAGFASAVVTNKPEVMSRRLLKELDLDRYFEVIVGGDTVATMKPDSAPVLHALGLLKSEVQQAIFIGDSAADAAAAASLSIPFILHAGGYDSFNCAEFPIAGSFHDYSELPEICIRLGTAG